MVALDGGVGLDHVVSCQASWLMRFLRAQGLWALRAILQSVVPPAQVRPEGLGPWVLRLGSSASILQLR